MESNRNQRPSYIQVHITNDEAPYLYNLLCDNARPWNRRLRTEISNFVPPRAAFLARSALLGKANELDFSPTNGEAA